MFPALNMAKGALESPVTRWLVLVLGLVAAFGAGRFSAPVEVETRTEVKTIEKFVERAHERKALVRTVYIERTPTDAGVVERTSIREEDRGELVRDTSRDSSSSSSTSTAAPRPPDWRVGLLVGATWKEPALKLGDTPLVVGATVERRIIGPLSLGAWGTTQGAAGVSVSGEF